jgi:decaprenylphospho-beta-D-ribofuranose 2-oxidase
MAIEIEDLVGLNRTPVRDMPIVDGEAMATRLLQGATTAQPLSLAGMRHSQGGHTMVGQGRMLLTANLNEHIVVAQDRKTVTVDAGATWSAVHRVLSPLGLAPAVHQSSPHFTVGGSISVNCHGRDPRYGPVSTTVRSLEVLCGDGQKRKASPTEHPDLFRAVIGGYGSCGLILQATLDVVSNAMLRQQGTKIGLTGLAQGLCDLAKGKGIFKDADLFYGWLCCVSGKRAGFAYHFYDTAIAVQYLPTGATAAADTPLQEDAWGESEMLRAGWSAARNDVDVRVRAWQVLATQFTTPDSALHPPTIKSRVNWMRASVDFAGQRDGARCDVLVEYFLPADDGPTLVDQIRHLGHIFRNCQANILSTTLRLVRADTAQPWLAYCGARPMVCVAIDVDISTTTSVALGRAPDADAYRWVTAATRYVLGQRGSYYLPYFNFTDKTLFQQAYPGWTKQAKAIADYNPQRKIWNRFLAQYF